MAKPGESFVYCSGLSSVPPGPTKEKVIELRDKGVVRPAARKVDGSWEHSIVKRGEQPRPIAPAPDPATDEIYEALVRAADRGRQCYSDTDLARIAGLATRDQAQWRVKALIKANRIRSRVMRGPDGKPWRIVTIAASGRSTRRPPQVPA